MREIKFQVWNKKRKVMYFEELGRDPDGTLIRRQYTGLKDKNGKDIYEGDIVQDQEGKHSVEWCEQEMGFRLFNVFFYKNDPGFPNVILWIDLEVIGNIYENPELLKATL